MAFAATDDARYPVVTTLSGLLRSHCFQKEEEEDSEFTPLPTVLGTIALCASLLLVLGAKWENWLVEHTSN